MAAPLEECTKEEKHSVICYFVSKGVKPSKSIHLLYRNACLSLQQVYKSSRKFKNGRADAPRPCQACRVVMPHAILEIQYVTMEHLYIMMDRVVAMLDVSHGLVNHIICNVQLLHLIL